MLDRLVTLLPPAPARRCEPSRCAGPCDFPRDFPASAGAEATILPGLDARPAPMAPLHPPPPSTTIHLQALHDAVERDLRAAAPALSAGRAADRQRLAGAGP